MRAMTAIAKTRRLTQATIRTLSVAAAAASVLVCGSGCDDHTATSQADPQAGALLVHPAAAVVDVPLRTRFVRLTNAIHPYARPELDTGRLDPSQRISNLSL